MLITALIHSSPTTFLQFAVIFFMHFMLVLNSGADLADSALRLISTFLQGVNL